MANDAVDGYLGGLVSGVDEVGYDQVAGMDDDEVGAIVKRALRNRAQAAPQQQRPPQPQQGRHIRSAREVGRRASGGFPVFTLGATIGATNTQTLKASRPVDIDLLFLEASIALSGAVVDSIKIGDEEQLLTPGVPIAMYGALAAQARKPDNFSTLPSGIDMTVTIRNTTAVAFTVTGGIKGDVER